MDGADDAAWEGPAAGTLIDGSYRVVGPLGQGGMGVVVLAVDERLERDVAIKLIRPAYGKTSKAHDRFLTEARAMARVRHENVVEIYAFGEIDQAPYFVMEYVPGTNVANWLDDLIVADKYPTIDDSLGYLELMVGKLLPYVAIGLIQTTLIMIVGSLLFSVPLVGSLVDLYAATLVFIAATLGLGLFVSTLAQTQFQAFQLAFVTLLPSILLSGFMFPFEGMPIAAQWIAQVLPLTHFNVMIRGIMLRGADLPEVWVQLVKLGVFLIVILAIAVARFKKRLD
jgi:hypothetical protein